MNETDMFRKSSKSVCTSTIVVFPDPLSPTPSTSSAMKTAEDPDDPKPVNEKRYPNGILL
jgi:hypothetical protein